MNITAEWVAALCALLTLLGVVGLAFMNLRTRVEVGDVKLLVANVQMEIQTMQTAMAKERGEDRLEVARTSEQVKTLFRLVEQSECHRPHGGD